MSFIKFGAVKAMLYWHNFGLLSWCKRDLRSSGMLRRV